MFNGYGSPRTGRCCHEAFPPFCHASNPFDRHPIAGRTVSRSGGGGSAVSVHPEALRRYLRVRRLHRAVGVPGDETARQELRSIDPHGILSMALALGEERAASVLRVRVQAMTTSTTTHTGESDE